MMLDSIEYAVAIVVNFLALMENVSTKFTNFLTLRHDLIRQRLYEKNSDHGLPLSAINLNCSCNSRHHWCCLCGP